MSTKVRLKVLVGSLIISLGATSCSNYGEPLPNLSGLTVEESHSILNEIGGYVSLDLYDETGNQRLTQPESGWKVCGQSPMPGEQVPDSMTLWVVKTIEPCDEGPAVQSIQLPSVGDTLDYDGIKFTLKSVSKQYSWPNMYFREKDYWLALKFKISNTTSRTRSLDSVNFTISSEDASEYLVWDTVNSAGWVIKANSTINITIGAEVYKSRFYQVDFLPPSEWTGTSQGLSFAFRNK